MIGQPNKITTIFGRKVTIDQCFIADSTLEELPVPSSLGRTKARPIDKHTKLFARP